MKAPKEKGSPEPVPKSQRSRLGRSRFVPFLAGLGALAWFNGYLPGAEPAVHALCSPHGTTNIYTVDLNNTRAQCLVVKGERFLYAGAYSEYLERTRLFEKPTWPLR